MLKLILLCLLGSLAVAASADAPLRLPDGRPFVCAYYFTHWWEPWKSNDDAIRADLRTLKDMGVSVIALDHEWSQAIDGNWGLLDRGYRLAKESGLQILPWLSAKVCSDMLVADRPKLVKQWYGVDIKPSQNQDGAPAGALIWDEATIAAGAAYAVQYLDRYRDQPLLHVNWQGRSRPVVALSVELGWDGGFDDASTARFVTWLRARHGDDVAKLNAAWGTKLAGFGDVNPRDKTIFDYAHLQQGKAQLPRAIEDHIAWRSQAIAESLSQMAVRVRRKYPDVLVLAELPYQFASKHPDAEGYRIGYASAPSCTEGADILFFRCTAPLTQEEADFLTAWSKRTGQPAIITHRTYSDWGDDRPAAENARIANIYADQAAKYGNGFGFYSWNEMVDTHVAPFSPSTQNNPGPLTPEKSAKAVALMRLMVQRYLQDVAGEQ
jgi:hypothetical protein